MHTATTLLHRDMNVASEIAAAGEKARTSGAIGGKIFSERRLEALYEMAFLRVFIAWEAFLEDTLARCLCGRLHLVAGARLIYTRYSTIDDAESALLGGNAFFSWADPVRVCDLAKKFIVHGQHQQVLSSNIHRLKAMKGIRNFIAHRSEKAEADFNRSALALSGNGYTGFSAGRFLRDKTSAPIVESRLSALIGELGNLAEQIAP
jgi:hypothetical protein